MENLRRRRIPQRWQPRVAATMARCRLEWACFAAGWVVIVVLCWIELSRRVDATFPARFTVLLQSLTPWVFLPLYPLVAATIFRRRVVQSIAAATLIVVHIATLAPAVVGRPTPRWVASAPRIRMLSANVYDANPTPSIAAKYLVDQPVDVLVLIEVSKTMERALREAGVDERFPFHQRGTFGRATKSIEVVYSRLPLVESSSLRVGVQTFPTVAVMVGTTPLRLIAVHVEDPLGNRDEWATELKRLRAIIRAESGPLVVVGDFNSTRWNPDFGALLRTGLHDASETGGRGLTFSWPNDRLLPFPVMRLDHGLGTAGVEAVEVGDIDVPGADHRGLVVTWAVRPG